MPFRFYSAHFSGKPDQIEEKPEETETKPQKEQ
jgi:hypothetical protein